MGLEFTIIIDKTFLFANVPNGKILLQNQMQSQGSFDVVQIITFHMNPKLTYVALGCTISIFYISITYFIGESYIRSCTNTISINANKRFAHENSYCCKC